MSSTQATDRTLVQRIRGGDEAAAAELYDRYAARVFRLVHTQMASQLRAQVEPEDIVQSTFRSIFRGMNAGTYEAPAGGTLWQLIAVIAVHKVRRNASRRAAAKRDHRRTQSLDNMETNGPPVQQAPEEVEVALREAVEGLKPEEQEVVLLRVQGYTVQEIGVKTDRSRRTVERLLQHARKTLTDMLDFDS